MLATAGDLVFWGDLDQKFRAFDAESGKILWETTLGGPIADSTITYAVNGRQYVAVMTGEGNLTGGLITQANIQPTRRHNRPTAAGRVANGLLSAVEALAELPNLGRPGRVSGTRELVVPGTPYVIPYRPRGDHLEIIAVFHGR